MNFIITTERLSLCSFTKEDASLIYELNLDPEVIRYTQDPVTDLSHAQQILEQVILPQYDLYGYGRWAVYLKSSSEFVGWCGLKYIPQRDEIDLGYRFKKQYWGMGYATEAARACIRYGFDKRNIKKIVGRAAPENIASVQVLKKCGMNFLAEELVDGLIAMTYEIANPSFPAIHSL
ncbi:MAG: GNAT family N-acetyltransferase [Chitinophagales bacterium]|nr:GNAT family N-acetyltransferase [Chitinophagales bacterium]